ncbi:BREX-4 system phosphatase PglZ [Coprothermobacteraceae bacterium]|nr:BREX-4 system phosphatase PglZ [Coprothermobacteraceae bacterium]
MLEFENLDDLLTWLFEDIESSKPENRRFPVRFIFARSRESFVELVDSLNKRCEVTIDLAEQLSGEDTWFTPDMLISMFKELSSRYASSCVVPLSEVMRFLNEADFSAVLRGISEIETRTNSRVYVPMMGLWERFVAQFWSSYYRSSEAPQPTILTKQPAGDARILLYHVLFDLELADLTSEGQFIVRTTNDWLRLWQNPSTTEILCVSKTLNSLCQNFLPDNLYQSKVIENPRAFLEHVFAINLDMQFDPLEEHFWRELVKDAYKFKPFSLERLLEHKFPIRVRSTDWQTLLQAYMQAENEYERWLLKKYVEKSTEAERSYIRLVFDKLEDLTPASLVKSVFLAIFDNPDPALAQERKKYITYLCDKLRVDVTPVEQSLSSTLNSLKGKPLSEKKHLLTSYTIPEKKHILESLSESKELSRDLEAAQELYPELHYYLGWPSVRLDNNLPPKIREYFRFYNLSKVLDRKLPEVDHLINELNANRDTFYEWYYSNDIESSHKLPPQDEHTKIIWVDGLGAEWFPLMSYFLEEEGKNYRKSIAKGEIRKAWLPTVTDCNRFDVEKYERLDTYVHFQNPYTYPDHIIEEIEIIREIAAKIIAQENNRIVIVADHGFSFLCQKRFGEFKKLDFAEVDHDGRCIRGVQRDYVDDYYFTVKTDGGPCENQRSVVALKHASLERVPSREVHGGATPEEVLVCYFEIERGKPVSYRVDKKKYEVKVHRPIIEISFTPAPRYTPRIMVGDRKYDMRKVNEKKYEAELKGLKPGRYEGKVEIGDVALGIMIEITGGFEEREIL